jgi:predicted O-linked N-acetylglucosamine transferase (SPINDLY family)
MNKATVSTTKKDVKSLLAEAVALQRLGKLAEAARRCLRILEIDGSHAKALALLGTLHVQRRDFERAVPPLRRSLHVDDKQPQTLDTLGNALRALKRYREAMNCYDRAIALRSNFAQAHFDRGLTFQLTERPNEAIECYDKAIALDRDFVGAHQNRGNALAQLERHAEAVASYDAALSVNRRNPEAYNNRGNSLKSLGRLTEALESYDKALAIRPDYFEAHGNRAIALHALERPEESLASFDRAIELRADVAELHYRRGDVLRGLKRWADAVLSYDRAVELRSDIAEYHVNRGLALQMGGWPGDALAAYEKAAELKPNLAVAYNNMGNLLAGSGRHDKALINYERAIALNPEYAEAYNNLGITLRELQRRVDALINIDQAIALKPDFARAHYARACLLRDMKRYELAQTSFDKALELDPDHAEAHNDRALLLLDLKQHADALAGFDKALEQYPELPNALGFRLGLKLAMCDWDGLEADCKTVIEQVSEGLSVCPAFGLMSIVGDPALQKKCAETFAPKWRPAAPLTDMARGESRADGRIRVAYLSADLRTHAVAFLIAGTIEQHDKEKFEIYGISLVGSDGTPMRARLEQAFEHFIDVTDKSDEEIAQFLREKEIDIAVDLTAYTRDARVGVFTFRPAPIQVNYLGYPGTTGADYMDYIIADKMVIAENEHHNYTEKVVYLPDTYQCNDSKRAIGPTPRRTMVGLPEDAFVFCSFNATNKIRPELFDIWMRLLQRVDGSVLWLMQSNPIAAQNLKREADKRGVAPERVIFAPSALNPDHLARHRVADLFLDTLPYGAHTTASDALWTGLPVLTCKGEAFPGRVAASLLGAIGLPELVTHSLAEYEARALELARNPAMLGTIKAKLLRNRDTFPLFDTVRFTRNLEAAYEKMMELHRSGRPPESFAVQVTGTS